MKLRKKRWQVSLTLKKKKKVNSVIVAYFFSKKWWLKVRWNFVPTSNYDSKIFLFQWAFPICSIDFWRRIVMQIICKFGVLSVLFQPSSEQCLIYAYRFKPSQQQSVKMNLFLSWTSRRKNIGTNCRKIDSSVDFWGNFSYLFIGVRIFWLKNWRKTKRLLIFYIISHS